MVEAAFVTRTAILVALTGALVALAGLGHGRVRFARARRCERFIAAPCAPARGQKHRHARDCQYQLKMADGFHGGLLRSRNVGPRIRHVQPEGAGVRSLTVRTGREISDRVKLARYRMPRGVTTASRMQIR